MRAFDESLAVGKVAESAIAKWLMRRGNSVLPVYEKVIDEGKGPQLFSGGEGIIAPDMLTMKDGRVLWMEAKHKTGFTWYRIGGHFDTGIDLRHYRDYLKVAAVTGFPVWLLFLQRGSAVKDAPEGQNDSPSGLYGNDILRLNECICHESPNWGRSGMVYWHREKPDGGGLKLIAPLSEFDI